MKASAKLIILFSLLFINHTGVFANPPKNPPYTTNICIRLTPNDSYYEILLRKLYLPEYRVDCQISNVNCDWLVVSNLSTNVEGDLYDVYSVSVPEDHKHDPDARYIITTTETGIIGDNGDYGEFDPHQNTQFTNIPGDRTVHWIIQWDLAPGNTFDVNDIPTINVGIPDNGAKQYILYGERDNDGVSLVDIDYLRFTPIESSCRIYASFPSPRAQCDINVNLIQLNGNNEYTTLASCTKSASNSSFEPILSFDNLDLNKTAFIEICFNHNASQFNVDYQLIVLNYNNIEETKDWLLGGTDVRPPGTEKTVFISFNNACSNICVEVHSKIGFSIKYYDNNLNEKNSGIIQKLSDNSDLIKLRQELSNLNLDGITIAKINFCQIPEEKCKIKLTRIKPIVLIHGIDACPRTPIGTSFFGSLIKNNHYWELRPYCCHDFSWDSMLSIKKRYIGKHELENYIISSREVNGLKATVVAHSAGCIMTYYECQEHNDTFLNNVDNIVFAAPPLLGSHLADHLIALAPIEYAIKRTSHENMQLIARGTEENWARGHSDFLFDNSRVTVVIGLKKYASARELATSMVDSVDKYHFVPKHQSFLKDMANSAYFNVDIWWDVIVDSVESIMEFVSSRASYIYNPYHSSELNKLNRSDSAVGTYAAYLDNISCFSGINSKFTNKIHSQIQLFPDNKEEFFQAIKDRLSIIDEEGD